MKNVINLKKDSQTQAGDIRDRFLSRGPELVDLACDLAAGKLDNFKGNVDMLVVLAKKMIPVIKLDDDSVQLPNLTDIAAPQQRIERLLDMAANGECSIATADNLIDILIRQVDVQDAGEIRKALDKIAGRA